MAEPVHIFSNGTEYAYWLGYNCDQCPYSCYNNGRPEDEFPDCKIEGALMLAEVTERQRWFAGYTETGDCSTWRCRYKQQLKKREAKTTAKKELAAAKARRQSIIDAGQLEMKL